jgi:hypothetical protein
LRNCSIIPGVSFHREKILDVSQFALFDVLLDRIHGFASGNLDRIGRNDTKQNGTNLKLRVAPFGNLANHVHQMGRFVREERNVMKEGNHGAMFAL